MRTMTSDSVGSPSATIVHSRTFGEGDHRARHIDRVVLDRVLELLTVEGARERQEGHLRGEDGGSAIGGGMTTIGDQHGCQEARGKSRRLLLDVLVASKFSERGCERHLRRRLSDVHNYRRQAVHDSWLVVTNLATRQCFRP